MISMYRTNPGYYGGEVVWKVTKRGEKQFTIEWTKWFATESEALDCIISAK
jgi:hypothetical protein